MKLEFRSIHTATSTWHIRRKEYGWGWGEVYNVVVERGGDITYDLYSRRFLESYIMLTQDEKTINDYESRMG